MKKLFVMSDIHGFYDEMMSALTNAGFDAQNDSHVFVSCGDLLDRGKKPLECLRFVNGLKNKRKILLRGNHEDLAEDLFTRRYFASHDVSNGTFGTFLEVSGLDLDTNSDTQIIGAFKDNPEWKKYIKSCRPYFETNKYVFTHGWIPCDYWTNGWNEEYKMSDNWRKGNWSEARWFNGMKMWNKGIRVPGKTVLCGHWHSSWGHCVLHNNGSEFDDSYYYSKNRTGEPEAYFTPFEDDGIMAIDSCCAYSGFLNCVVLEVEDDEV